MSSVQGTGQGQEVAIIQEGRYNQMLCMNYTSTSWCVFQKVEEGIINVFWSCISHEEVKLVLKTVLYPDDLEVNVHLFAAMCCVAQRMLHFKYKSVTYHYNYIVISNTRVLLET